MIEEYKLLKDTVRIKAGTVGEQFEYPALFRFKASGIPENGEEYELYTRLQMENNPDWFAPVTNKNKSKDKELEEDLATAFKNYLEQASEEVLLDYIQKMTHLFLKSYCSYKCSKTSAVLALHGAGEAQNRVGLGLLDYANEAQKSKLLEGLEDGQ